MSGADAATASPALAPTSPSVATTLPRASGPVEEALLRAIAAMAPIDHPARPGTALDVELLSSSKLGDFRLDLRPLLGDLAFDREAGRAFAHRVGELPLVESAVAVPPRLYVKVPVPWLYSLVTAAVRRQAGTYGRSGLGRGTTVFVAFSDPNINKPLHLGHFRNNFIGMSLAALLSGTGHTVERHTIHTDWGIHICQALVAYLKWGAGETPTSTGSKGDHLVGRYYVMFHTESERQREGGDTAQTPLEEEAAELLRRLSDGDGELRRLRDSFVSWADEGILQTYDRIGTTFDAVFYESRHLDGCNELVDRAIARGQCHLRPDGSAFIDLSDIGVGPITLRRRDGTPVVYSQWIAVDCERFGPRSFDNVMVLLGQEWEPGYSVLLEILRRFGERWADRLEPLYYGMVKLPEGRMKSRQGTGLTGDELLDRVRDHLRSQHSARAGSIPSDPGEVFEGLALALVKYHFLTGRRGKDVLYREADLWERTLPRLARIFALSHTDAAGHDEVAFSDSLPTRLLRPALLKLDEFPRVVEQSLLTRDPSVLVRYLDGLATAATACRRPVPEADPFFQAVGSVLRTGLGLLNIDPPSLPDVAELLIPSAGTTPPPPVAAQS